MHGMQRAFTVVTPAGLAAPLQAGHIGTTCLVRNSMLETTP